MSVVVCLLYIAYYSQLSRYLTNDNTVQPQFPLEFRQNHDMVKTQYPDLVDYVLLNVGSARNKSELPAARQRLEERMAHIRQNVQTIGVSCISRYRRCLIADIVFKAKPDANSPDVWYLTIPGETFCLRFFAGGMQYGKVFFDLFDRAAGVPINTPSNCTFWLGQTRVLSLEECFGVRPEEIFRGQEKYCVQSLSFLVLRRPGWPDLRFRAPEVFQSNYVFPVRA